MQMSELIADQKVGTPEERTLRTEELGILRRLMETIDEREAQILRLRFGLDGQEPLTLKEIAADVGISRERVRQIVEESLQRLNERLNDSKPSRFFRRGEAFEEPVPGQEPAEKLTTSALRQVATGTVDFQLTQRRRDEG